MKGRPIVTTLCGSTRFPDAFALANMHLSMMGRVVLSVGMCAHADQPTGSRFLANDGDEATPEKQQLDQLHFRKIDISDGIFVVNPGGYVGSSTRREIAYARSLGKSVEWLFPPTDAGEADSPESVARVLEAAATLMPTGLAATYRRLAALMRKPGFPGAVP